MLIWVYPYTRANVGPGPIKPQYTTQGHSRFYFGNSLDLDQPSRLHFYDPPGI